uniref:Uncharacterized protein n=1 Tax=Schlesneria paludicola TaxID=360056 RepID=A0A7C2JXI1_9PLAN
MHPLTAIAVQTHDGPSPLVARLQAIHQRRWRQLDRIARRELQRRCACRSSLAQSQDLMVAQGIILAGLFRAWMSTQQPQVPGESQCRAA